MPSWRNWPARMTSNHKVASSSLAGGTFNFRIENHIISYHIILLIYIF